jgi:hypothetical protein
LVGAGRRADPATLALARWLAALAAASFAAAAVSEAVRAIGTLAAARCVASL